MVNLIIVEETIKELGNINKAKEYLNEDGFTLYETARVYLPSITFVKHKIQNKYALYYHAVLFNSNSMLSDVENYKRSIDEDLIQIQLIEKEDINKFEKIEKRFLLKINL